MKIVGKKSQFRTMSSATTLSLLLMTLSLTSTVFANASSTPSPISPPSPPAHHAWQIQVGVQSSDYAIQGMAFLPAIVWINVGDTITWSSASREIHTVTFLQPGQTVPAFNAQDPLQIQKQGSTFYDGSSYYNSGLISNVPGSSLAKIYRLTFSVPGNFSYYCLVHPSQIGTIHVRPAGTSYPFTGQDYHNQTLQTATNMQTDGLKMEGWTELHADQHKIIAGIGDGLVSIMRFMPAQIIINLNATAMFINDDPMTPHTVTFGLTAASGSSVAYGNANAFDGSSPLNSGFLMKGASFNVKFVKSGIYTFRCDLHASMGMFLRVVVLPTI